MKKYYYLLSLLFIFTIPAGILGYFLIGKINLANLIGFILGIAILGSIWDIWATKHGKKDSVWLWQFNFKDTLGIHYFGLPVEEYLFYIATSLYIIFIWESIRLAPENNQLYFVLFLVGLWSLIFTLIPYFVHQKNDRIQ